MAQHTIHYWLIGRPDEAADAAYDAGLTDPDWVVKGPGMFVEFTREGESAEAVAKAAADDLRKHRIPFDERTLGLRDPTEFLSEHPGYFDDEELDEQIAELQELIDGGEASEADVAFHACLVRNKASGNKEPTFLPEDEPTTTE